MASPSQETFDNVGTYGYKSPELLRGDKYGFSNDIWALGCLLYVMCTYTLPFEADNDTLMETKIRNESPAPIPSQYTSELQSLIDAMLKIEVDERLKIDEVVRNCDQVNQN